MASSANRVHLRPLAKQLCDESQMKISRSGATVMPKSFPPKYSWMSGTTTIAFNMGHLVIMCADGQSTSVMDGEVKTDKSVKLHHTTQSIFVAAAGRRGVTKIVMDALRERCEKEFKEHSFDDIVSWLVSEAEKIGDISEKYGWHEELRYNFLIGGKLENDSSCKLATVRRIKIQDDPAYFWMRNRDDHPYSYMARTVELRDFGNAGSSENFVREFLKKKDTKLKLKEAMIRGDRAGIANIMKEAVAVGCTNDPNSGGWVTMISIDARGFHIIESADPIKMSFSGDGYKESVVDGFCPIGYNLA